MKTMNLFLFLAVCLVLSCQKNIEKKPQDQKVEIQNIEFQQEELNKHRVSDLLIILFKKDINEDQWTEIFKGTQKLSSNKRKLLSIEGLMDNNSESLRIEILDQNAKLFEFLSSFSVYILNWSFGDENCRFLFKENLNLLCKPRNLDNPLNGGLPQQDGFITYNRPNPVTEDIKVPYLNIYLSKKADDPLKLQLRLKLESKSETEFWFKGDVLPLVYKDKSLPFPYGYVELTTAKIL